VRQPDQPLAVGYVVNQYPKISHSFIRREIRALEARGVRVSRYSVRAAVDTLVDPADIEERSSTRVVLSSPVLEFATAAVGALRRPVRLLRALSLALQAGWKSERGLALHFVYLAEAAVVARWAEAERIGHLHAHFGTNSASVAMLAAALAAIPFSFTVHGPEEFDKVHAIALPLKLEQASFAVAISAYGRSQLLRWIPHGQWGKVCIVRCGVDARFLDSAARVGEPGRLLCVARLSEQKGLPVLIEACRLLKMRGVRFRMVIAGDGPLRDEIERQIRANDLGDVIDLLGWVDERRIIEETHAACGFVLPSFAEGLPVVLMESMALGKPVVTTWVAGIPELVAAGDSGWLCPPSDVEALAAAMQDLLTAPGERRYAMGARGREQVRLLHDVNRSAAALEDLFRHSVSAPR
jgi:glycosyltransferase involved in cell wall biosynthesis